MNADVDSRPPPIIYHGPQNQTLPVNSVATLSCSASGEPAPVISWYRNRRVIPSRDRRFTILQSGALQITGSQRGIIFLIYSSFIGVTKVRLRLETVLITLDSRGSKAFIRVCLSVCLSACTLEPKSPNVPQE